MNRFEGVLIGTDSFHKGEAVLLHHLEEVFVEMEEEPEVVLEQSEKASVGIFTIVIWACMELSRLKTGLSF
ncbi:hypothetical protein [Allobaculum sp. Allo2]|uniref:hypothetical protein n=1 Tax=Allobaculum sp. Allo2 TaxID=2853432 RepID=UPI001F601527|nr:hypothetical protein [Allobaculum sp. Allo2]UNT92924.1 hypothetical protein KWG61_12800 [Allobaculum sp. Allo2]